MRTRLIIATVVAAVVLPVVVAGLLDPLEGGVAMLVAAVLIAIARLVSKVRIPRLEWVSWLVAMIAGVTAIVVAVTTAPVGTYGGVGLGGLPFYLLALLAVYEIGVVATFSGAVQYLVRIVKALRLTSGSHPRVA